MNTKNLLPVIAVMLGIFTLQVHATDASLQDCSVLDGTWKTTFSINGTDKLLDWKWQTNVNPVSTEVYDTSGKLLSSSTVDSCTLNGNTINYRIGSTQVRLEISADKRSFTGSSIGNGALVQYAGQRVGGEPVVVANNNLDSPPPSLGTSSALAADIKNLKRQADSLYAQKGDREAQKQAYGLYGQIAEQSTDKKLLADVRAKMKKLEKVGMNKGGAGGGMPSADSVMAADSKNCPEIGRDFRRKITLNNYVQLPGGTCGLFVRKGSPKDLLEMYRIGKENDNERGSFFYVIGQACYNEWDGVYLVGTARDYVKFREGTSRESFIRFRNLDPYNESGDDLVGGVNIEDIPAALDLAKQEYLHAKEMERNKEPISRKRQWEALGCIQGSLHDYQVAVDEAVNYYKTGGKTVKWYGKTIDPNKK